MSLGVQLCVRSRAVFALTEAGKRLFLISQAIKSELRDYENFLRSNEEFDGLLSVGVIDNFQNDVFEKVLKETILVFPKMKLNLQVYAAAEIQNLVVNGEMDIGLGIFNSKLSPLTYRVVGFETISHFISENHPLWNKQNLKKYDLTDYSKSWVDIVNRDRISLQREIFQSGNVQNLKISAYTNNLNAALLLLRSGTSIVPMPIEYLKSRNLDFKYRSLDTYFSPFKLKQELVVHKEFMNASPAAKFFVKMLPAANAKSQI